MTNNELTALLTEVERAKKANGKNIKLHFNLTSGEVITIEMNEDGSYPAKRKPTITEDYLTIVEKQIKVGENRTSTAYEETFRNIARIIPCNMVADSWVESELTSSTPIEEPEQSEVDDESTEE
jgi:hypothetical protein